ncbi:NAD-dependent epimerase/dehydratase family protein [Azotobacter salinestris]|uniref:NAD-dependent epimerase/dehydratase family protein n=1 Tax=Azotobacter salinestris TaxID=69964 RepID=UPI0032E00D54
MRVLLTGGSGFVGRYVLDSLQRRGIPTVAVGRCGLVLQADSIEADLLEVGDFSRLLDQAQATHLLHLAWYAEHGKYWASPLNLRWVDATTRLVEAFCGAGGCHVVVAGTCAEYDWSHGYCREDSTPLVPATLYGAAKDATRRLVAAVCESYQVTCAWGRIFLPFGTGEASSRLVPSLIDVLQGGRMPFGVNSRAYRDFLHVSDVAEGLVSLLLANAHGVYNISSGQPIQLAAIVTEIARLCRADPQVVLRLASERPSEPPLLVGESLKLRALGWMPQVPLMQGLARSVQEWAA